MFFVQRATNIGKANAFARKDEQGDKEKMEESYIAKTEKYSQNSRVMKISNRMVT